MINFYDKLSKEDKSETKLDKHFKNHNILPNSMIAIIGGTGSGKSNALVNLISKQNSKYFDIIIIPRSYWNPHIILNFTIFHFIINSFNIFFSYFIP